MCQSLGCGAVKEVPAPEWKEWTENLPGEQMMVNCSGLGRVDHLWQCVSRPQHRCTAPASVLCAGTTLASDSLPCYVRVWLKRGFQQTPGSCSSEQTAPTRVGGSCRSMNPTDGSLRRAPANSVLIPGAGI